MSKNCPVMRGACSICAALTEYHHWELIKNKTDFLYLKRLGRSGASTLQGPSDCIMTWQKVSHSKREHSHSHRPFHDSNNLFMRWSPVTSTPPNAAALSVNILEQGLGEHMVIRISGDRAGDVAQSKVEHLTRIGSKNAHKMCPQATHRGSHL
jgi:hypothetical protein